MSGMGEGPMMFPESHYRIRAWGSETEPDLNYDATEIPRTLYRKYPFIDIQRLDAVPLSALKDRLHG